MIFFFFYPIAVPAVYDSVLRHCIQLLVSLHQDGLVVLERCCRRRTFCLSSCSFLSGTTSVIHATHREGKRDTTNWYCTTDLIIVCDDLLWYCPHCWRVQRYGRLLRAEKQNIWYTEEPPILLPFQSPRSGAFPLAGGGALLCSQPASSSQPHTATQAGAFALRLAFPAYNVINVR